VRAAENQGAEDRVAPDSPEQLTEYLAKTEYVAGEIHNKRFYKRSGKWCSYCDYLPVCVSRSWLFFGADSH
jgi:hypothetical protein